MSHEHRWRAWPSTTFGRVECGCGATKQLYEALDDIFTEWRLWKNKNLNQKNKPKPARRKPKPKRTDVGV